MATTDAAGSYEGGVGGKIRKRPLRRAATPYDRPPTALRNPSATATNGWLSKLVDPASRLISGSAARLFSSVFRKRLAAPPTASEMNIEPRHELAKDTCITPSGAQEQGGRKGKKLINNSDNNGINKLEQLLKQKTFTRVEFDRLSELLRSRIVDLSADDENKRTEPSTSQAVTTHVRQEKATISAEANGVGSLKLFGSFSTPSIGISAVEEVGSPAELAKAYMGTRLSKVSPSSLHLQSQTFREDVSSLNIVPSSLKSPNMSFGGRVSGVSGLSPTPRGRSAVYGMARSPYFRGAEPTDDRYAGPSTSSQWPRTNKMLSTGKQALKRRGSVLDDDFGSVGPIRRIRQKCSMISPSKDRSLNSMPLLPVVSDSVLCSKSSNQKLHLLDERQYNTSNPQAAENGDDKISNASYPTVPPQSSEMARKILQQLDKLVPSPKEKSSELKLAMAREKSPSKLILDMLNGRALKSMEDIESPKLKNVQESGSLNGLSSTHFLKPGNFISHKQDRVGSMMNSDLTVLHTSEAGGEENAIMSVKHSPSVVTPADSVVSGFAATPPQNKRAFQMNAPEDYLEMDDDDVYSSNNAINSPAAEKEKPDPYLSECKTVASETVIIEKPLASFSESNVATNFASNKGADLTERISDGPNFAGKDVGFTFSTPEPSTPNLPQPLSTAQSPSLLNPSVLSKEQTSAPAFSFGSKSREEGPTYFTLSSTTGKVSDAFSLNSGAGSDSKSGLLNCNGSNSVTPPATPPEAINKDRSDTTTQVGNLYRSLENAGSSGVSTPNIFSFGASTNSSQSNGFPTSSTISISTTTTDLASGSSRDLFSSSSNATTSGCNMPSILATFSTSTPSVFKFGSGTSTDVTSSSSLTPPPKATGLEFTDSELKAKPASFFSITSPSLSASSSSLFTSTTSSIFGFNSSAPTSITNSSNAAHSENSTPFGAASGSIFGTQAAPAGSSFTVFTQTMPSQSGSATSSPLFGSPSSSSFSSDYSFGSTTNGAKLSGSGSGFGLSSSSASFSTSGSSFSSSSSSFTPSGTTLFGSSSQLATSSIFSTAFGSTSPATGFSFGASTGSAGSMPQTFGSSLGVSSGSSMFSFTSAAAVASSSSALSQVRPLFGMSNPVGFGLASPGNDQMNVEDSMAEDIVQASTPMSTPVFGQLSNTPSSSNFVFVSPAMPSGGSSGFQFGAHPTSMQNPSPFPATGSLELPSGGSFSLGTGGVDKSSRKIMRVRRDKHRKK